MAETQIPDVKSLGREKLGTAKFPGDAAEPFRIFVAPEVHKEMTAHARENMTVEICGVLVGQWQRDERGPFVAISNSIRGDAATSKLAEVTFTHETWARINKEMDARFTDKSIVGWYHTHPDFGIFLSDRDRFIHEHFFSGPGQIAYVIDPVRKHEGAFMWREGKPQRAPYFWVGSRLEFAREDLSEHEAHKPAKEESSESPRQREREIPAQEPRAGMLMLMLAGIGLFFLGYLLQGRMSTWERDRIIEGTVFHYGTIKGMTLDLPQHLIQLAEAMRVSGSNLAMLAENAQKGNADPQVRAAWEQALQQLTAAEQLSLALREQYTLSPEEQAAYMRYTMAKAVTATNGNPSPFANPAPEPPPPPTTQSTTKPAAK